MDAVKIEIKAYINASLGKVWLAYTQPNHIVNWNFANKEWCCPYAENQLEIGGRYKARMEAKDGSFGFDFEGVYSEVDMESRLHFVMPDQRHVIIDFSAGEDNTLVKIAFDAETSNSIKLQRDGWQSILNNFKNYVEHIQG